MQKWGGCRSSSCVGTSFFILPSSFFIRTSGPQATTATAASLLIYNRRLWLHALNAIGMPSQQSPHLSGFLRVKRFSRQAVPFCLLACGIWPSHVWDRFQSLSMRRPCRIARSVPMKQRQESERNARPHPGPLPPGEGESFARVLPIGTRWVVVLLQKQNARWRRLQP